MSEDSAAESSASEESIETTKLSIIIGTYHATVAQFDLNLETGNKNFKTKQM